TWRASRANFAESPNRMLGVGAPISYRVTLEPHNRRWVFALDLPKSAPSGIRLTDNYQLLSPQPITARARFELSSQLNYQAGLEASAEELANNLQVPPGNSHAVLLAQSFKSQSTTPQQIIDQTLAYFRAQGFVYTLTPPTLEQNPVDRFIFETKSGFCEH